MKNIKNLLKSYQVHPYHLVEPSPWPLGASFACLVLTIGGVLTMHNYILGGYLLPGGIILVIYSMINWWRDVIREGTFQGHHTKAVKKGLNLGVILFIISELFFFISFFWAFFHSSLSPSVELGSVWPPVGIESLDTFEIPLLNTVILLLSGATITVSHHKMISGDKSMTILYLIFTILLATLFLSCQYLEYNVAQFTIADSVFGSVFFITTGFHGFHVIIGALFLLVSLNRIINNHLTKHHHLGYEAAILYWHFVDLIWLFVFTSIYWWGG